MNFTNFKEIKKYGFQGFKTVSELWTDRTCIPKEKGVYLVIDTNYQKPEYINPGVGGFFKGKDPNVSVEWLKENHVPHSPVIYIGKAGSLTGNASLYSRLGQYLSFGRTKNIGHWGGRLIWQIKKHPELIFCWKLTPQDDPRDIEQSLLREFMTQFGKLPFANLNG